MRARHARTEVTGVSLLRQNFLALVKLVSARTLADLKKVSPGDADSLNHSLSDNLYGREKLSIFDREFMTEVEFHALFAGDEAALDRIGVRSVAELMMYVDVTGKPRLGMNRGSRLPRQAQKGCRGKKDEEHLVAFAPFQLAQVRQTVEAWMEQALKDSVRTVTPGSRSLGPNALASPGLLGSADSGGLHGACTQRQCQNPQGLYPKPKLPANTGARGRGHGRSRTQRPDVCPLCQRCQCSHYGIEVRRDGRGS